MKNNVEIKYELASGIGPVVVYEFTCEFEYLRPILLNLFNFSSFSVTGICEKISNNETFIFESQNHIHLCDYKKITIKSI